MNLRTLKKHCRRAVAILIAEHGYRPDDFLPAAGEETLDAPIGMEARFVRNGFLSPGPLAGTPLAWARGWYGSEGEEPVLPIDVLSEIILWRDFEPTAEDLAA
ncbi:hypothetical protein sos41_11720 [Alphaproteobacteria bacterium SO-S41]|nr:hypothetical protein sos41_11720 [Alphaproteobacteria bacterium SO-S41]